MIIRQIEEGDLEQVLALQNQGWTKENSPVSERKRTLEDLLELIESGRRFLVAENCGQIAGLLDFSPYYPFNSGRHVITFGILIKDDYQGQGLGSQLLEAFFQEAKRLGYRKISMHVLASNQKAITFYQKAGFGLEARLKKQFLIDDTYVDGLIFGKWIGEDDAG